MDGTTRLRWDSQQWTLLSKQSYFFPTRPTDLRKLTSGRMTIKFFHTTLTFVFSITWKVNLGPPTRQPGPQCCGHWTFYAERARKEKSPSSPRLRPFCPGNQCETLCRCGRTWWLHLSMSKTATGKFSTMVGLSFPLPTPRCEAYIMSWRRHKRYDAYQYHTICRWQPYLSTLISPPPSLSASSLNHGGSTSQYLRLLWHSNWN